MTFVSIRMLFLIWTVPLVFLIYLYGFGKRRRILSRFASPVGLASIAPETKKQAARRWVKAGLVCISFLLIALALSGPRYGYSWKEVERKGIDIIIALDCSRSMLAEDIQPTRLARAKREVYDLLGMLQGDRVGLVAFAGTAFLQCPLTLDYSAFHLFLDSLSPDFLPVGGSDLAGAVTTALSAFDPEANSEKAIILITDGESTGGNPLQAAEDAKKAKVKLFTIGVGRPEGVPLPDPQGGFKKSDSGQIVVTKLDEKLLEEMALETGGTYARSVAGDMDLDVIYSKDIRGKMAQTTLTSTRQQVWENRFQWPLAIAILLLVVELLIPLSNRRAGGSLMLILSMTWLMGGGHAVAADRLEEAESAYEKGAYEKSLNFYIQRQLDEPDRPEVLYNIGNAYYKLGDFDQAASHFKLAAEGENAQLKQKALYNLGNAVFRQGQLEEAATRYEAALQIDPQDQQAKENLEFVKQLITRQQQAPDEQQEKQGEQKTDSEKRDGEKSSASPSSDPGAQKSAEQPASHSSPSGTEDEKSQAPQPTYGKEMDPREGQDASASDSAVPPEGKDRQGQAEQPEQGEAAADHQAAQRLLNRLEDKPGKAMIPAYSNRHVEKDW